MKSLNSNGDCASWQLLPSHSHTHPSHFSLHLSLAAEVRLLSPSRHVSLLIFSPHFLCLISKKDICLSELYMLVRWEQLGSGQQNQALQLRFFSSSGLIYMSYFYINIIMVLNELLFQFKLWFFFWLGRQEIQFLRPDIVVGFVNTMRAMRSSWSSRRRWGRKEAAGFRQLRKFSKVLLRTHRTKRLIIS